MEGFPAFSECVLAMFSIELGEVMAVADSFLLTWFTKKFRLFLIIKQ